MNTEPGPLNNPTPDFAPFCTILHHFPHDFAHPACNFSRQKNALPGRHGLVVMQGSDL
jgi:hypothetical protein